MSNIILKINSIKQENIELITILDNIANISPEIINYNFAIVSFDGSADKNFKDSFMDFLEQTNSQEVFITDFHSLKEKIYGLFQIYDLLILIDENTNLFKNYSVEQEDMMYKSLYITISYFDGGFWEISCKDKILLENMKNLYVDAEWIEI